MKAKRDIFVCYNCATNYPGKLADPDWPHNCLADETLCYCISTDGKDCPDYVESCACTKCWGVNSTMNKLLKAVREASISVACLLDDVGSNSLELADIEGYIDRMRHGSVRGKKLSTLIARFNKNSSELEKDIQHLQNQITIIENSYLKKEAEELLPF